jgi:hypothetical protein
MISNPGDSPPERFAKPRGGDPALQPLRPQQILLLAALDPNVARLLRLAWVDREVKLPAADAKSVEVDAELVASVGIGTGRVDRPAAGGTGPVRAPGPPPQHVDHAPRALRQVVQDFRDDARAVPPRRCPTDAAGIRTKGLLAPRGGR